VRRFAGEDARTRKQSDRQLTRGKTERLHNYWGDHSCQSFAAVTYASKPMTKYTTP